MEDTAKIYVVAHKDFDAPQLDGYIPILAGAARNHAHISVKDNTGDEISSKNPQYCELTAQYWVWKNAIGTAADFGFVHYRRYFYLSHRKTAIVPAEQFVEDLKHVDAVLPEPWVFRTTVKEQFAQFHDIKDLQTTRTVLQERHSEYVKAFDEVMCSRSLSCYNMFVMSRSHFERYMTWLFDILEEVEHRTDTGQYDAYNQRLYGFLSERLLNVWVRAQKLRIKYYPVYKPDDSWIKESLKASVKKLVYSRR
ncbi:DUF4422 domain-containing protein [Bifidobacterium cuniculi]|uniref:Glycosyl transferase family protein n=1 Tax=Bifidobacterium cuniculi TaxID=1688 RepID=A0A087AEV9_9BIFI|nr:DUF4422 domain-containing protein [Bifidobacterium cuniculi]KFI57309.1 glycosyl transferase family protein [Bifidobacterium cuniculi]